MWLAGSEAWPPRMPSSTSAARVTPTHGRNSRIGTRNTSSRWRNAGGPAGRRAAVVTGALVAATVASYAVGWALNSPPVVPLLNVLASYPFMVAALRRGDVRLA